MRIDQRGFTLIELLTVMSLTALLFFGVTISYQAFLKFHEFETNKKNITSLMTSLRVKSMVENTLITVYVGGDGIMLNHGQYLFRVKGQSVLSISYPEGRNYISFSETGTITPAVIRITSGRRTSFLEIGPLGGRLVFRHE